jgi:hypothetical protein
MQMFLEIIVLKCQNLRKFTKNGKKKMQKMSDEHSRGFLKIYFNLIFSF